MSHSLVRCLLPILSCAILTSNFSFAETGFPPHPEISKELALQNLKSVLAEQRANAEQAKATLNELKSKLARAEQNCKEVCTDYYDTIDILRLVRGGSILVLSVVGGLKVLTHPATRETLKYLTAIEPGTRSAELKPFFGSLKLDGAVLFGSAAVAALSAYFESEVEKKYNLTQQDIRRLSEETREAEKTLHLANKPLEALEAAVRALESVR